MISLVETHLLIPPGFMCVPSPKDWRGSMRRHLEVKGMSSIDDARKKIVEGLTVELTIHISTLLIKLDSPQFYVGFVTEPKLVGEGHYVIWSDQLMVLIKKP